MIDYPLGESPQRIHRRQRWPSNLDIVVLDTLAVRLFFPLAAKAEGGGLFNLVSVPIWLAVLVSEVKSQRQTRRESESG